jgi:hypothetical protein
MINQDVVISMIGAAVVGDQTPFIDATHSAGVKRFIPRVIGPDTLNPGVREVFEAHGGADGVDECDHGGVVGLGACVELVWVRL